MGSSVPAVPSGHTAPAQRLTQSRQALLSLYWFATSVHWGAILTFLLPTQAEAIGGAAFKGQTLGIILAFGAFVSMCAAPIFGAWSDRTGSRWGRRAPFLVLGTLLNVAGLLALAFLGHPGLIIPFIIAFMVVELASNVASAPYSALIPDLVPHEQRGSASGWMGLMNMLGSFVGAGLLGFVLVQIGVELAYVFVCVVLMVCMAVTGLGVREPASTPGPRLSLKSFWRGLWEPFASHDFRWVFWTRLLVMMGTFTVQTFILYFMQDVVGVAVPGAVDQDGEPLKEYRFFDLFVLQDAEQATGVFTLMLLVGALLSTLVAGRLSDRYGRKMMVYLSGGIQALVIIVFTISHSFPLAVLLGLIFGLGYGAYQSVDWALASDVLPSHDDHAKDMGVWHVSFTLPQVIATPIAGLLLDVFQRVGAERGLPNLGYTVIFGVAAVYFVLGTVFVYRIRGVR